MSRYRNDRDDYFGSGRSSNRYPRGGSESDYGLERDASERGDYYERGSTGRRDYDDYGRERFEGSYNDYGSRRGARDFFDDYGRDTRYSERAGYEYNRPYEGEDEGRGGPIQQRYERRGATRSHVRCRDIMTRDVTVATRDTTLRDVAAMMRDEDTGVIPVVDRAAVSTTTDTNQETNRGNGYSTNNGKLVGLITDRDIVIRAIAEGKDANATRAEEIMTTDIHSAQPNDRVIDAIRKMGDKQVRRIPVVDRDGNLRGIISMADVALETEEDRELAEALEEISSGSSFWSKIFG